MKLDRCKNGHIYDVSRYSSCPYCKSEGLETEVQDDKILLWDGLRVLKGMTKGRIIEL